MRRFDTPVILTLFGWRLTLQRDADAAYRRLARRLAGAPSRQAWGLLVVGCWVVLVGLLWLAR